MEKILLDAKFISESLASGEFDDVNQHLIKNVLIPILGNYCTYNNEEKTWKESVKSELVEMNKKLDLIANAIIYSDPNTIQHLREEFHSKQKEGNTN